MGGHSLQNWLTKQSADWVQWLNCLFQANNNASKRWKIHKSLCLALPCQVVTDVCCFSVKAEQQSHPLSTVFPPTTRHPPWSGPTSSPRAFKILWTPTEWAHTGRSTLVSFGHLSFLRRISLSAQPNKVTEHNELERGGVYHEHWELLFVAHIYVHLR